MSVASVNGEEADTKKPDAHYQLVWHKQTNLLTVNLCYQGRNAITLTNHSANQAAYTRSFTQNGRKLTIKGARVKTRAKPSAPACVQYDVDVSTSSDWRSALKNNDAILLNTKRWFWFSSSFKSASFEVTNAEGKPIAAFFPFKRSSQHVDAEQYDIANTGLEWDSKTLLGNVQTETLQLNNTSLNIAIAGAAITRSHDWLQWLKTTAEAIESVYGRFPQNAANVLLIPIGKRSGAIPWGEVQRGGYPSIHFYIDETRPINEFIDDWTGSHELSHLFLPKLIPGARWMSEGVASYYQYVARSRTQLISKETAWHKMKQGFKRGRRDFNQRPLISANKTMHVYWGGAAYFLLADIELRRQGKSLDSVLAAFSHCCLPSFKRWSPQQIATQLDSLSHTSVFSSLLQREAAINRFPLPKSLEDSLEMSTSDTISDIFTGRDTVLTKG